MAFVQKTWKNRISEFFNRYRLENAKTGEVSTAYINLNDGAVEEEGDKINADALNDLEGRIAEAFEGTGKGSNFVGTLAQWNALTDAEKEEYDTYDLTDDFEGYGVEMDVTSGSTKVITSGGVANHLIAGNRKFYFDYQDGKYGYNTSANRGADTFFPFSDALEWIWYSDFGSSGATIPTTLTRPSGERTYEFEAIVPEPGSYAKCLFSFGGSNSGGGVITLATTYIGMYANGHIINDTSLALDQEKHHYAIVLGTGFTKFYVDKQLLKTYSVNGTATMKTATSFVFGSNQSSGSENWSGGTLYKLAVTDRADGEFIL